MADDVSKVTYLESSRLLNMKHEIAAVQIFHNEEKMRIRLKGAEKMTEKRMFATQSQNFPLDHRTLDVVVLQHDVLLQAFDRVIGRRRRR